MEAAINGFGYEQLAHFVRENIFTVANLNSTR